MRTWIVIGAAVVAGAVVGFVLPAYAGPTAASVLEQVFDSTNDALKVNLTVSDDAIITTEPDAYDDPNNAYRVNVVTGGTTQPSPSLTAPTATASNCAANGTTAMSNVAAGTYLLTVTDEQVFLCDSDDGGSGTDCATLGTPFVVGTQKVFRWASTTTFYCRSANATGDVRLTALTY